MGTLYLRDDELLFINVGTEVRRNTSPLAQGGPHGIVVLLYLPLLQLVDWLFRGGSLRSAMGELDEIEDESGAMPLDAQFAACPGSFRIPLSKLASTRRTMWGALRLTTILDDVYVVRLGGRERELEELLSAASSGADVPSSG
ncbi:MAG: hypothetical protein KTR31_36220 [Myxococcales bacterium]|nr:hypothetical protein [Myxococcales bacterium]